MIAIQIVHDIATLDPPGRFLIEGAAEKGTHVTDEKQDVSDKVWVIVEEDKAINKVMHRLRERDKSAVAGNAATSRGAQDPSQVLSHWEVGKRTNILHYILHFISSSKFDLNTPTECLILCRVQKFTGQGTMI